MPPPVAQQDFSDHCRSCASDLRDALRSLYDGIGADIAKPQEVSRQFKLNKNLTWKIAKVLQTNDALEAVPLIPGSEGMEILLGAMSGAGASAASVQAVRTKLAAFEHMVEAHVGDRATLELLMDGRSRGGKALEVSRKLAFRGNSGIWGVQARARSMMQFLAPNREQPDRLDLALVGGLHDIRRLRPVQGWPLFRFYRYGSAGTGLTQPRAMQPIEPPAREDEPHLIMRSFCSPPGAEVRSVQSEIDVSHELVDGPIGQRGSVSFVFGMFERAVHPRYADPAAATTEFGEMGALITMPVELVEIDILVHRDLINGFVPELVVYGRPHGNSQADPSTRENYRLPIDEPIVRIDPARDGFNSDILPDQPRLVKTVCDRAGWDTREFTGFRVVVPYPPMPSTVMVRYALPRAPGR